MRDNSKTGTMVIHWEDQIGVWNYLVMSSHRVNGAMLGVIPNDPLSATVVSADFGFILQSK